MERLEENLKTLESVPAPKKHIYFVDGKSKVEMKLSQVKLKFTNDGKTVMYYSVYYLLLFNITSAKGPSLCNY